jgi:hypothetical protein
MAFATVDGLFDKHSVNDVTNMTLTLLSAATASLMLFGVLCLVFKWVASTRTGANAISLLIKGEDPSSTLAWFAVCFSFGVSIVVALTIVIGRGMWFFILKEIRQMH